jgi:hypothetical protein
MCKQVRFNLEKNRFHLMCVYLVPARMARQGYQLEFCDQKLASDSSGLPGGFSGQRAWVRIFKKWAPGSYCLELVVACPAAGTSAQILLVEGK